MASQLVPVSAESTVAIHTLALATLLAALPAHAEEVLQATAPAAAAPAPRELVDSAVSTLIDGVKVLQRLAQAAHAMRVLHAPART